jgi:hypothetical protein
MQIFDREAVVPEVEILHRRILFHRFVVGPDHGGGGPPDGGAVEVEMLASDGVTGCEPLDIPLPRSGKGLVEVVCVEDRRTLVREARESKLDRWASPPRCTCSRGWAWVRGRRP